MFSIAADSIDLIVLAAAAAVVKIQAAHRPTDQKPPSCTLGRFHRPTDSHLQGGMGGDFASHQFPSACTDESMMKMNKRQHRSRRGISRLLQLS